MSSSAKFLIGGVVVALVIGGLIAVSFSGSTSDYLTVAQAKAQKGDSTRAVRVAGEIVPDSINYDTAELHLTFAIRDDTGQLSISYHGPQPDMLVDAVEAVAVGRYNPETGMFEADELLMKCPSKYEER
ncbi:MAG TPA: cytochrome c maturation protein CcmE [Anaerolineae bacterium]|nr:cytochrome c maturation protein CcmE [Anaerolineae bacterium]